MIFLVSFILTFLIAILFLLVYLYIHKKYSTDIYRRMRRNQVDDSKNSRDERETILQTVMRNIRKIAKPLEDLNLFSPLDLKLKQAGISLTGVEFIIVSIILTGAIGMAVFMITINQAFAILIALFVPALIWAFVLYLISKRKNTFTEQLGDCLMSIADAMRAGYSFQQALDIIVKEMEPPISQEFLRVSTDLKLGVPLEEALKKMNERVDSADFGLVTTAVLIQREVGGNLAQILDTISETIAERIRMKREIKSLTSQGRFSAIILVLLPFVTGAFSFFINPELMSVFFEESIGRIALISSVVMAIIGFIIIHRIVDIDV